MTDTNWTGAIDGVYTNTANYDNGVPSLNNGIFGPLATHQTITIPSSVQQPNGWIFTGGAYTVSVSGSVFFGGVGVQGSAAIDVLSGGTLTFLNQSDAGSARYITVSGAVIVFSGTGPHGDAKNSMGSLEGAGEVDLANGVQLTVDGNNSSGVFSGNWIGGSLVKTGVGTLTLSGNNQVDGGITLLNGGLELDSLGAAGGGNGVSFGDAPATLQIDNAAIGADHFNPPIVNMPNRAVIDLSGFRYVPLSVEPLQTYSTLTVDNGQTSVIFDHWFAQGTRFAALDDHASGTMIVPAIIATLPHELIDAGHHPLRQPSLINGPDTIVALGAYETIKALGGNTKLVLGAPGITAYGGPGDNTFAFLNIKASPPSHPDTLMDFHHGGLIDLYDLHFALPSQHHVVFIGAQPFDTYNDRHPRVTDMVRYAAGVIEVNVNHNLAPSFTVKVHGAPHLHFGYLAPGEPLQDFHGDVLIY
jgi:autotransporter-associated beta strand protein